MLYYPYFRKPWRSRAYHLAGLRLDHAAPNWILPPGFGTHRGIQRPMMQQHIWFVIGGGFKTVQILGSLALTAECHCIHDDKTNYTAISVMLPKKNCKPQWSKCIKRVYFGEIFPHLLRKITKYMQTICIMTSPPRAVLLYKCWINSVILLKQVMQFLE